MTPRQFRDAVAATRMRVGGASYNAANLVLVEGYSSHAAAKAYAIHVSAVSRAVARLRDAAGEVRRCHVCHQPLPAAAA